MYMCVCHHTTDGREVLEFSPTNSADEPTTVEVPYLSLRVDPSYEHFANVLHDMYMFVCRRTTDGREFLEFSPTNFADERPIAEDPYLSLRVDPSYEHFANVPHGHDMYISVCCRTTDGREFLLDSPTNSADKPPTAEGSYLSLSTVKREPSHTLSVCGRGRPIPQRLLHQRRQGP